MFVYLFLLIFVDAVVVPKAQCSIKFDILIIVDGSASVTKYGREATGDHEFYKNKIYTLVKNIISKFDIGDDKVQIGLLFFGSKDIGSIKNQVMFVSRIS